MRVAKRLGEHKVYLWTDIPQLYVKFGWEIVPEVKGSEERTVAMRWNIERE